MYLFPQVKNVFYLIGKDIVIGHGSDRSQVNCLMSDGPKENVGDPFPTLVEDNP